MTYLLANGPLVWRLTVEHLEIAGLACLFAILVGCPLGVLLSRVDWLWGPVLGAAGAFYTVPSIALFAALIPLLGLGTRPTVVALVLYCQLPLIRNTAVGPGRQGIPRQAPRRGIRSSAFRDSGLPGHGNAVPFI